METVLFAEAHTYIVEPADATCLAPAPGIITLNPPAGSHVVEVNHPDATVTLMSVLHDGLGAAGPSNGGLISVVDGALTLLDNEVRNATASFGGCINVANGILNLGTPGPLSMDGTRVWGCVAGVSGGGILVGDLAQFTPAVLNVGADSTIDGNGAGIAGGGGIAVAPEATANVFDNASVFLNETSGVGGGGVRTSGALNVFDQATIHDNTAACSAPCLDPQGGGILALLGNVSLADTARVEFNHAAIGGGVALSAGTLLLADEAVISDNDALHHGGGLSAQEGSTITLAGVPWVMPAVGLATSGVRVENNDAGLDPIGTWDGGGIWLNGLNQWWGRT